MVTEEELSKMSPEQIAELQKQNCIFCKIVSDEVPGKKVYEDDKIIAILDIRPASKGHILVMPKEHYPVLALVPGETSKHMFGLIKDLCSSVRLGVPTTGTTVFMANGAAAGQMSPHFLFHIIPRGGGDGLDMFKIPNKDIDQTDIKENVQKRLGAMLKTMLVQEGKLPPEEVQEVVKQQAAMLLEQNPQLKQVLIENPDAFKQALEKDPRIAQMFQGIDIDMLSKELGRLSHEAINEENGEGSEDSEEDDEGEETDNEDNDDDDENDDDSDDKASLLDKVSGLFK